MSILAGSEPNSGRRAPLAPTSPYCACSDQLHNSVCTEPRVVADGKGSPPPRRPQRPYRLPGWGSEVFFPENRHVSPSINNVFWKVFFCFLLYLEQGSLRPTLRFYFNTGMRAASPGKKTSSKPGPDCPKPGAPLRAQETTLLGPQWVLLTKSASLWLPLCRAALRPTPTPVKTDNEGPKSSHV